MSELSRRSALGLGVTAGLTSAVAGLAGVPAARADSCSQGEALAASISAKLFDGDGLARPVPEVPTPSNLAAGLDRTLVLGGGGEYYVAWYCGFFHGLLEQGVDPAGQAEMVVGTSAGAYIGSSMTSGHFQHLRDEFDFFGQFPARFAQLAPVSTANASQQRAREINFEVTSGDAETIRLIGHAALAADNSVNGDAVERLVWMLTDDSRTGWPPATMFTTANDCYTGQRLVVGQDVAQRNGIALAHAAGASSSLPGVIGPTLVGQRYCMDGGISKTWAHTDVVAGSKRALVITLTNGYEGSLLSGIPHNIYTEIDALKAVGTTPMLIIAGTPPGVNLLDPNEIAPAIQAGYDRAKVEAPKIREFYA
ncbi:patatin-like phospholipase family protein [Mycolicibacterium sp. Dal123E01]|uniref:patatin-like phospholipase family protein n=1 Tax=Mycolicibacterium sp. Dal123E01 TaxID=3457578 RepID=UPI00403E8CA7